MFAEFFATVIITLISIITILELKRQIEESYTPTPVFHIIKEVYDVKEWLGSSKLCGHSKSLCFEFNMGQEGVVMKYKD